VVAVAPFGSPETLYRVASPPVREMIDRLNGRQTIRDVRELAQQISCPMFVVCGALDEVVPVEEVRSVVDALTVAGAHLDYLESPHRGHDVLGSNAQDPVTSAVTAFLTEPATSTSSMRRL
jgi:esterase/lipase